MAGTVSCGVCGHENPSGAKFCAECGNSLIGPVADERFASPERYTPRELADKILAARHDLEGERKLITALFADVVGFTALSERLDPEDAHALMRSAFELMLGAVHRYEGTVTKFLGDGMLALFGAPIAHEDHAYRAVRAGLALQQELAPFERRLREEWDIEFRVRVGVNSGPVVVGNVGSDLSMEYLAIGDTVNLASRIQDLCPPGSVAISANTSRLVRGQFVTRDLGEHTVKGKELPVRVHEVIRPVRWRSRVDVYAESGLGELVGREHDLAILLALAERSFAGRGQVVFVQGEAGIGKSRLLYELRRALEERDAAWLVGRCVSYAADVAYFPIIDLVHDAFSIEEGDSAEVVLGKLTAGVAELELDAEGLSFVHHLLGVEVEAVAEMDPQLRKARTFEALRDVLVALAGRQPTVITLEDLHWVDRVSTEFLSYLIETVTEQPILLLLTHRPDWDAPFGPRPNFTQIALASLNEEDSARVAEAAAGNAKLPPELGALIHRKTEGNPFFVEEVVKSLVEMGALQPLEDGARYELARPLEDVFVPDTVQDVIMARLDRLDEDPKRALQTAAVIGREFTVRLLERTANLGEEGDGTIDELKAVALIHERSLYPELAFMFRHALTHDVAYNSLLVQHRKGLHQAVGRAIEEVYADRLADNYETLAYHYEQAQEWDKAVLHLVRSGEKALAASAPSQALRFFERAVVGADALGDAADRAILVDLHRGRGEALTFANRWEESARAYDAMAEVARETGDLAADGGALVGASNALFLGHRFEEALDYAARARELSEAAADPALLAGSLIFTEAVKAVTGELDAARDGLHRAVEAATKGEAPALAGIAHVWSGFLEHWQGREERALEAWAAGRELGERHGLPAVMLWILWNQGLAHIGCGRYDEAHAVLQEHLELTKRLGDTVFRCRALNTLGWLFMDLCNWELAVEHNLLGAEESRRIGDPEIIRNAELNLADCMLALGDLDEADRLLRGVEHDTAQEGAWGEEWMKWRYRQHLHASLGELRLRQGELAAARGYADRCIAAAEQSGSLRNVTKGRRLRAAVSLAEGNAAAAAEDVEVALDAAREVGNPAQLRETLAVSGAVREAQGRRDEAAVAYDAALRTAEEVAEGLAESAWRAVLLDSAQVAALRRSRDAVATG